MNRESNKPKPARYQYVAATLIGGITALMGLLMMAAFVYLLIIEKPHAWKALGFGLVFLLIAAVRVWGILRVKENGNA